MNSPKLYITDHDLQRLRQVIADARRKRTRTSNKIEQLERELARRVCVAAEEIPSDVITLNSDVQLLDLDDGEVFGCTLVVPEEADIALFKISALAPVGLAMLGHRVGDTLEWPVPAGVQRLEVVRLLYQPAAAVHKGL